MSAGDPHEVFYRFGGKQMGMVGNNGVRCCSWRMSSDDQAEPSRRSRERAVVEDGQEHGYAVAGKGHSLQSISKTETT